MYKIRILLLSYILITFSHCSSNSEYYILLEGKEPSVHTFSIELDYKNGNNINYGEYFIVDHNPYYAWVDPNFSIINVYNFTNGEINYRNLYHPSDSKLFLSQLNNPVLASFFVWNENIVTFNKYNLGQSEVLQVPSLDLLDSLTIANGNNVKNINYTSNPLTIINNTLYLTVDPEIDHNTPIIQDSLAWIQAINLINGESHSVKIPVPNIYKNKLICPSSIIPSLTKNHNENIILAWPSSFEMFIYNPKSKNISSLNLNLDLKLTDPSIEIVNTLPCANLYDSSTQLEMLKYSPYENLYYLFYSNPDNLGGKTIGLHVLDSAFNNLGIVQLKKNTYNLYGSFISLEGISIPRTNILNENLDENQIVFDVYSFN